MLAYITGSVDEELLLRNEYPLTENRILRNQIKGRILLTDPERISLAEIAKRLGRKVLEDVAQIVRPETIIEWHRKLIARKFDGSKNRVPMKLPSTAEEIEVQPTGNSLRQHPKGSTTMISFRLYDWKRALPTSLRPDCSASRCG